MTRKKNKYLKKNKEDELSKIYDMGVYKFYLKKFYLIVHMMKSD